MQPRRAEALRCGPRRVRRVGAIIAAVAAAWATTACLPARAPAPDPARAESESPRRVILATEADDQRVGDEAAEEAIAELGLLDDDALQELVASVGQRLAAHVAKGRFEYRFRIVDEWTPNAFALPGGAIFISRGLLALTNSEDELAAILAHEIIHVAMRHAAARQWVARATPFAFGWWGAGQVAAYARNQEREADEAGQRLAARAGYDPTALTNVLRTLEQEERMQLGRSRLPSFLQQHPSHTERMAISFSLGQQLAPARSPTHTARERDAYLRRLEGLVVGPNPAGGVFRGDQFLHPDLDISVLFPPGFRLVNTARMVAGFDPTGSARVALEMAGRGDDPRVAVGAFLADEALRANARIEAAQSIEIGGRPAYELRAQIPTRGGWLAGQITWIAHEGIIYRISAVAPSVAAKRHLPRTRGLARSFRSLTPEERESIRVERLRLVRVDAGETVDAIAGLRENTWHVARTALLNGMLPGTSFDEPRLAKIVASDPYTPPERTSQRGEEGFGRALAADASSEAWSFGLAYPSR